KKLGIPVIGILDTNADPDDFQYPIPGNDDAIRSVSLLTRIIADAAAEGLQQKHNPESGEAEPLAEWEAELLQAPSDDAAAEAPAADAKAEEAEPTAEATEAPADAKAEEAEPKAEATEAPAEAADAADAK
ncbi:MAG: 30S ribosomal protein S2, partial [Microbacterium sp.]|uniref:30S ribosomal protein S2 n=1 Tax=Microbacterium sp. TaxID=51671 RepID=UPI003F9CB96A